MVCLHSLILQLILMRKLCLEIEKLNWFSKTRRLKILSTYLVSISKSMAQKGSYQQGTRKLGRKPEPKKSGPGRVSRARYQKTRKTRVGFRVFSGFCTLILRVFGWCGSKGYIEKEVWWGLLRSVSFGCLLGKVYLYVWWLTISVFL